MFARFQSRIKWKTFAKSFQCLNLDLIETGPFRILLLGTVFVLSIAPGAILLKWLLKKNGVWKSCLFLNCLIAYCFYFPLNTSYVEKQRNSIKLKHWKIFFLKTLFARCYKYCRSLKNDKSFIFREKLSSPWQFFQLSKWPKHYFMSLLLCLFDIHKACVL